MFRFTKLKLYTLLYGFRCIMAQSANDKFVKRLGSIEGLKGKWNDIIYHPAKHSGREDENAKVFYFGGDVQDYPENMAAHRDNKHYLNWNLEMTTTLLSKKFPTCEIYIVKPARMQLKTFSCFDNFVNGDEIGSPKHELSLDSLRHLKSLLENINVATGSVPKETKLIFIGFSKGCVVLNQFLYAFEELANRKDEETELVNFAKNIDRIYWLDGGHSGGSITWITDRKILKNFANTKIKPRIHVSPYQMERTARPWVGKEEKIFRENLRKSGVDIVRKMHFENEPASLEFHFKVLELFEP